MGLDQHAHLRGHNVDWQKYFDVAKSWATGQPERHFPGGENKIELITRFKKGLKNILAKQHKKPIIIVAHGGILITSLSEILINLDRHFFTASPCFYSLNRCFLLDMDCVFLDENFNSTSSIPESMSFKEAIIPFIAPVTISLTNPTQCTGFPFTRSLKSSLSSLLGSQSSKLFLPFISAIIISVHDELPQ